MAAKTLQEFLSTSKEKDLTGDAFELESPHMLEARIDGLIWAKAGAMIARKGNVKFTRQGMLEQGLGNLLKKAVSGEGMTLMKVEGQGRVYLADVGKKITVLRLQGESIFVNGNDVLATESTITNEIKMMRKAAGMMTGGLFNVKLSGSGLVAITSHYEPLTLPVSASTGPVFTDPNATVAWSGGLSPEIVTDISFKTLIGRGSGESIQLRFAGEGWVVVQPYEEVYFQQGGSSSGGGLLGALVD
ncbi:AIM24 family protein [Lysobacter brunescens]|uniref:AIM24 family protein n=1 Tax=Lysobacter brunescens TaxID=262323 RepID=A0ABW2YD54_9GAMM